MIGLSAKPRRTKQVTTNTIPGRPHYPLHFPSPQATQTAMRHRPSWGCNKPHTYPASALAASTPCPSANMLLVKTGRHTRWCKSTSIFGSCPSPSALRTKLTFSCVEFTVGALLWISRQPNGNLSRTGLGDGSYSTKWCRSRLCRRGGHKSIKPRYE